jgi:hypothetical protein
MEKYKKLYNIICELIDYEEQSECDCYDDDIHNIKICRAKKWAYTRILLEIYQEKFEETFVDGFQHMEEYIKFLTDINYDFYLPKNISRDYFEYLKECYFYVNFLKFLNNQKSEKIDDVISLLKDIDYNLKEIKI